MWCKHCVIRKIPPAGDVTACCIYLRLTNTFFRLPSLMKFLSVIMKCLLSLPCCLFCRVATPSGSYSRLPRRQCPKKNGVGPQWSWKPRQACVCCLKTKPVIFWRRWGTFSLCPQTVWHKHHPSHQRAGWKTTEKPLLTSVTEEKAASLPIWWLSCCEKNSCCGIEWSNHICHLKH